MVRVVLGRRREDPVIAGQGAQRQISVIQIAIPEVEGCGHCDDIFTGSKECECDGRTQRQSEVLERVGDPLEGSPSS